MKGNPTSHYKNHEHLFVSNHTPTIREGDNSNDLFSVN